MLRSLIVLLFAFICAVNTYDDVNSITIEPFEKDKLLACNEIVSKKYQLDMKMIEDLVAANEGVKQQLLGKISGDLLASCINRIEDNTVNSDLVLVDFQWTDDYNKLFKIDYSKYRSGKDLELTPEQHILFYKLDKCKNEFSSSSKQRQEKASKTFPPILGIDITKVSPMAKIIYSVVVFSLIVFGILYGLKKLQKTPSVKKTKKSKNC